MNYLEKVNTIISKLNIPEKEKDYYCNFFKDNPNFSEKICYFWNEKQKASELKDSKLWHEIFDKELQFVELISSSGMKKN